MIVYVRDWEKLREIETFGEFDFWNGEAGYVIKVGNQAQLLNKSLTYKNIKEAKEKYLADLSAGAEANLELKAKYEKTDMEVIRPVDEKRLLEQKEQKVLTEKTK